LTLPKSWTLLLLLLLLLLLEVRAQRLPVGVAVTEHQVM
jgi:hypothetical protein